MDSSSLLMCDAWALLRCFADWLCPPAAGFGDRPTLRLRSRLTCSSPTWMLVVAPVAGRILVARDSRRGSRAHAACSSDTTAVLTALLAAVTMNLRQRQQEKRASELQSSEQSCIQWRLVPGLLDEVLARGYGTWHLLHASVTAQVVPNASAVTWHARIWHGMVYAGIRQLDADEPDSNYCWNDSSSSQAAEADLACGNQLYRHCIHTHGAAGVHSTQDWLLQHAAVHLLMKSAGPLT